MKYLPVFDTAILLHYSVIPKKCMKFLLVFGGYLCLDVLLRCRDQAGTAQPQHHHDGQEQAGCQYPAREAWPSAEGQRQKMMTANTELMMPFILVVLQWFIAQNENRVGSGLSLEKKKIFWASFGNQSESSALKLRPPRHAAQEVVLRRGVLSALNRVFSFPPGFGGAPLTAAPHTCKETEPSVC